jgi:hypothetical protein
MNTDIRLRLDHAEELLTRSQLVSIWPRCTSWLLRLALERALAHLWSSRCPALGSCSARAQLLALGRFVDAETQHRVSELWHALSRAGHHHHYELAPTAAELHGWLQEARHLAARLAQACA